MKKSLLLGFAGLLTLVIFVLVLIYGGLIDVAADAKPSATTRWVLRTTMVHSVRSRAATVNQPAVGEEALPEGASSYRSMCVSCHGAPGIEPDALAEGLHPQPPRLAEKAGKWSNAELFWIVKHGIKMTGMPAYGPTHDDKALWPIVLFVAKLPQMTENEYQSLLETARTSGREHDHSGHSHGQKSNDSGSEESGAGTESRPTGVLTTPRDEAGDGHNHGEHSHD